MDAKADAFPLEAQSLVMELTFCRAKNALRILIFSKLKTADFCRKL
jgi:hypothetical protein